jgi:hypothetical protein
LAEFLEEVNVQELWRGIVIQWRGVGVDLVERIRAITTDEVSKLKSPAARVGFDALVDAKCDRDKLALLLLLGQAQRGLTSKLVDEVVGSKQAREATARALNKAASQLESHLRNLPTRETFWAPLTRIGLPISPPQLVAANRLFASLITLEQSLIEEFGIRSPVHVFIFLLSEYVEAATGRPNDAHVSTLISGVLSAQYTEWHLRKWRERYYDRLAPHFSVLVRYVAAWKIDA